MTTTVNIMTTGDDDGEEEEEGTQKSMTSRVSWRSALSLPRQVASDRPFNKRKLAVCYQSEQKWLGEIFDYFSQEKNNNFGTILVKNKI